MKAKEYAAICQKLAKEYAAIWQKLAKEHPDAEVVHSEWDIDLQFNFLRVSPKPAFNEPVFRETVLVDDEGVAPSKGVIVVNG